MKIEIFGIRHHGPGCSRHLANALKEWMPDVILIETPEDLQPLTLPKALKKVTMPAAIMSFDIEDTSKTFILPYTMFSPEYVAMQFATQNDIPYFAIDLPLGAIIPSSLKKSISPDTDTNSKDLHPFEFLAHRQGMQDVELWWEIHFERVNATTVFFEKIKSFMLAIKEDLEHHSSAEIKVREAWMRQKINHYASLKYQKIAVICGASHLPFLDIQTYSKTKADEQICDQIKLNEMKSNWIPWAYKNVSSQYGQYNAGVKYPAYFEYIFREPSTAGINILSDLNLKLRKEGFDLSPAHTIETIQLAKALSVIRGYPIPGVAELIDAAQSVYNLTQLTVGNKFIEEVFVGTKVGDVQIDYKKYGLIVDFKNEVKRAKLSKYLKTPSIHELTLDLRKDYALLASKLLWRLRLVGINWGTPAQSSKKNYGTFNEFWTLEWQEQYYIYLFQLNIYGKNIENAVLEKVAHNHESDILPNNYHGLAKEILLADIYPLTQWLIHQLKQSLIQPETLFDWMQLCYELITTIRLGSVRAFKTEPIEALLNEILPKIIVNVHNMVQIQPEEDESIYFKELFNFHHVLTLWEDEQVFAMWLNKLLVIIESIHTNPYIKGWSNAQLYKYGEIRLDEVVVHLKYEMSDLSNILQAAKWLQGFLSTQVFTIYEAPPIIHATNQWLEAMDYESFRNSLPILRKAFFKVSPNLKKNIKHYLFNQTNTVFEEDTLEIDPKLLEILLPSLTLINNSG